MTYKLTQLGHDVQNWSATVVHAVNVSTARRRVELRRYKRGFMQYSTYEYSVTVGCWHDTARRWWVDYVQFSRSSSREHTVIGLLFIIASAEPANNNINYGMWTEQSPMLFIATWPLFGSVATPIW